MALAMAEPSEVSLCEGRRRGLTTPERACMKKNAYMHASEECILRHGRQHRRRRRGGSSAPAEPALLPAEEARLLDTTLRDPLPEAASWEGEEDEGEGDEEFEPSWADERMCSDILDQILPLPPRSKATSRRRAIVGASATGLPTCGATSAKGAGALGRLRPGSKGERGRTPSNASSGPGHIPAARLQMLRRPHRWDADDSFLRNVIRLVQGACATKVEREVGGRIRFIHAKEEEATAEEVAAFNAACQVSGSRRAPVHKLAGQTDKGSHSSGYTKGMQQVKGHPLQQFRRRMLAKFATTAEAFDAINLDNKIDSNKLLNMREWCDVLVKAGMSSMFEARVIFELMDADRDGTLTMREFNFGIEAIAPVTTLAALRKRLVCLGFTSMLQAISVMNGPGEDTTMQPLNQIEFGAALRRVWVIEDSEHRALFNLVRDHIEPSGRASLSDLACGLAAVSPCILVAEARSQLIQKFGSLSEAYEHLDDEWLASIEVFEEKGSEWLNMTRAEAAKIFRFTDIDRSGYLSRSEITGVIRLSQASIQMEDTRRIVQQSYRGIEAALRESFLQGADLDDTLRFNVEELLGLLQSVDMSDAEKRRLVTFLVGTSEEGLTLCEFFIGIRLFAPSCALEGIRLQLLRGHERIVDAFKHIRNRRRPLGREELRELLRGVGVTELAHFDIIFDVLDVRSSGLVTVTELMAALRGSESGTRKWLGAKEREEMVEHRVRGDLATLRDNLSELKQGLRSGHNAPWSGTAAATFQLGARGTKNGGFGSSVRLPKLLGNKRSRSVPSNLASVAEGSAAAASRDQSRAMMRRTFQRISNSLDNLPKQEDELKVKTVGNICGYFASEEKVLGAHEPYVRQTQKKAALFSEIKQLQSMGKLRTGSAASASSGPAKAQSQSLPNLHQEARAAPPGGTRGDRLALAA